MEKEKLREQKKHGSSLFPFAVYEWKGEGMVTSFLHWHEEMEIIFFKAGNFTINYDMKEYEIDAPAFLLIPPEKLHRIDLGEKQKEYALVFQLSMLSFQVYDSVQGEMIHPLLQGTLEFPMLITEQQEVFQTIKKIYLKCLKIAKKETMSAKLKIKSYLLEMIAELYESDVLEQRERKEDESAQLIKKVLNYIENHYQDKIKIQELADFIGMNPQYFCRFFKRKTGKTFITYLNQYRLERSKKELSLTKDKIIDIAAQNGFENIGYFMKQFKAYTGMTPGDYRKENKSK